MLLGKFDAFRQKPSSWHQVFEANDPTSISQSGLKLRLDGWAPSSLQPPHYSHWFIPLAFSKAHSHFPCISIMLSFPQRRIYYTRSGCAPLICLFCKGCYACRKMTHRPWMNQNWIAFWFACHFWHTFTWYVILSF